MKVLLNITTLNKGGALQASVSFIREALHNDDGVEWCFAVSSIALRELINFNLDFKGNRLEEFDTTPAKSILARRKLAALERDFRADVVFTFFGPAYVNFKAPHICGVADGWVSHSSFSAFRTLGISRQLLEFPLRILHKAYWYRKADAWVVEASCAKLGLNHRFRFPLDRIYIVPNNCGQNYLNNIAIRRPPDQGEKIKILCLSAYYPHKNLELIPYVAKVLRMKQPNLSFEFIITLPDGCYGFNKIMSTANSLGVAECIKNVGPVAVIDGPVLYKSCHITFLPSLLETFSANYPEAMAMGLPIVTTDLQFARNICKDAALYFNPLDASSAASVLLKLIADANIWQHLVHQGMKILKELPTPTQKYGMYINHLRQLSQFVTK